MGTVFPDSEEFPNHEALPTSWPDPFSKENISAWAIAGIVSGLCPALDGHVHGPEREYVPVPMMTPSVPGSGSSSIAPPPSHSSMFDSADAVIRAHHARRNAQTWLAMSTTADLWSNPNLR